MSVMNGFRTELINKIVGFNAAGMQGLIAAKILSARGRKYMTEKKMSQILGTKFLLNLPTDM